MSSPRMGASFRANQMSVHAETARNRRDGWTDRQTAFRLYIVDVILHRMVYFHYIIIKMADSYLKIFQEN